MPDLFPDTPRHIAEASQEAFAFVRENLQEREVAVFLLVAKFLQETGRADVTGGELSAWSGEDKTILRPRLTGLRRKGWLHSGALRDSGAHGERRCHPYWLALPVEAIARLRKPR